MYIYICIYICIYIYVYIYIYVCVIHVSYINAIFIASRSGRASSRCIPHISAHSFSPGGIPPSGRRGEVVVGPSVVQSSSLFLTWKLTWKHVLKTSAIQENSWKSGWSLMNYNIRLKKKTMPSAAKFHPRHQVHVARKKHHSPHPPSVVDPQHNNPGPKALIPITKIELICSSVLKSYQIQSEFVWQRFCPSWPCQPRVTKEPSFGGMLFAAIKCATVPATPQHAPPKASSATSGHQRVQKGFGMAHTNLE